MTDEQQRQADELAAARKLFHSALSARSDRDPGQRTAGALLIIAAKKLAETGQADVPAVSAATLATMDPDQQQVWKAVATAVAALAKELAKMPA